MQFNKKRFGVGIIIAFALFIFLAVGAVGVHAQMTAAELGQTLSNTNTNYLYPTDTVNPWTQSSWSADYCNKSGMDFLVLIDPAACSPAVVRSDLLEEQDVPVLCRMTGIKINPLIQVPYIKSIVPVVENKSNEIGFVNFLPARAALSYYAPAEQKKAGFEGLPTMNNLGYLWIQLKQQPSEDKMPDKVIANMSVKIRYDIARTFGINENQFVLPLLDSGEWSLRYKEFGFWKGKGYLKLQEITGLSSAKISVYTSPNSAPIKTVELREGVDPTIRDEIMLPGFYCGAGLKLRLDEITVPTTRARVLVNGNELLLGNSEPLLDSGCEINNIISSSSYGGSADIKCVGSFKTLTIKDYEAQIEVKDPDARTVTATVGTDIMINKDNSQKHFYVGFIGKEYTNEGFTDFMILFSRSKEYVLIDPKDKEKIVSRIHEYIKSKRGVNLELNVMAQSQWITEMKELFKNQNYAQGLEFYARKTKLDLDLNVGSLSVPFKIISVTGPEQIYYTKDIEDMYKGAKQKWRDVAFAYANQPSPQGTYYGVIALHNAADLASSMHKKLDQAEILTELINKYSQSDEPEIIGEVENAREELRRAVAGAGDRSVSMTRPSGSYHIELISIEKPGLGTKEAQVELNDTKATITVDDTIGDWVVSEIDDTSIRLKNLTNNEVTLAAGSWQYFSGTKVRLLSTTLKKEVKVTVLPFEKERETITNFTVAIGIEKRAIKLTPEKTNELIEKLNKNIASLEKIRDNLGKIVTTWKKVCQVGAGVLWIKNFVSGLSGEAYARKIVMKPWTQRCSDSVYRQGINAKSISDCYRIKEKEINNDIELVQNSLSKTNKFISDVKSKNGVTTTGGLLGLSKTVNDEKFMEEAEKNFPQELEGIKVYEQKELRRIILGDGAIEFEGVTYANISKLLEAKPSVDKSKTAKILNNVVNSENIAGNFSTLYSSGRLFKDDVKNIVLDLDIYKQCSGKSQSEIANSAICQEKIKGGYGTLAETAEQVKDLNTLSAFSSKFGISPTVARPQQSQSLKAQVYRADLNFINKIKFGTHPQILAGDRYSAFSYLGAYYIAVVDSAAEHKFTINRLYKIDGDGNVQKFYNSLTEPSLEKRLREINVPDIEEVDITLCNNNEIKTPHRSEIKFWESGVYEGFVAWMPVDARAGWYVATTSYSGLEGAMAAWKESGDINTFWICNVGVDGLPNFDYSSGPLGDDCCTQVVLATGNVPEIAGCITPGCSSNLINKAKKCSAEAIREFAAGNRKIHTSCGDYTLGKPPVSTASAQCEDFMSASDCKLMYNLCDPVMCPASRCDFGGRMPVEDVVQTGVVGSLLLCLPNFDNGKGVIVPICLTGVHAGIDSFIGIMKSGRDCLQEQLKSGKTVGICDQITSVYMCEFFWKQLDPFLKAGIPAITESLTSRGGGEYALFSESWKQSVNAARYFTDYYALNSFNAFKARSTGQIGSEVCKKFVSTTYPTQSNLLDELSKPESPTQATAWFDEIPMGGASPDSHYKVFAYIFAGNDQGAYYSIYLRRPAKSGYYEQFIPEEYLVKDGYGYLGVGQYLSISPDFTAPSGYKEICIRINQQEICGFGQASTNFAVNELQNVYLQNQLDNPVETAKECVSGTPSIIPTATLNIQSYVESSLEPQIYKRGIVRICSSRNPGESVQQTERYKRIGYCDNKDVGCWLDMNSVNESVSDLGIRANIVNESDQKDIAWAIDKYNLSAPAQSQIELDNLEPKLQTIENKVNAFITEVRNYKVEDLKTVKVQLDTEIGEIAKEIDSLSYDFKQISARCARADEKARAEFSIAKLYDLKAKLYASREVYQTEMKMEAGDKCVVGQGGKWMTVVTCPTDYEWITNPSDSSEHPGQKCCREIVKIQELEFMWPVPQVGVLGAGSCFGYERVRPKLHEHKGLDINAAKGTSILAVAPGKVIDAENNEIEMGTKGTGYGNYVTIEHEIGKEKVYSFYGHMKTGSVRVKKDDIVKAGDKLGEADNTGYSEGDHLHLEIRVGCDTQDCAKDPLCFFSEADRTKYVGSKCTPKNCQDVYQQLGVREKVVKEEGKKCEDQKTKTNCDTASGCWWDSKYNNCKNCPNKCEGDTKGIGVIEYIGNVFGGNAPAENDLVFKTQQDCEQNECSLACLWFESKCQSINDALQKKMLSLNTMSIEDLNSLKLLIENNRASLSNADVLLGRIATRLQELQPQAGSVSLVYSVNNGGSFNIIEREKGYGPEINYGDSVKICAVVKMGNDYYSGESLTVGNKKMKQYSGDASIKWFNIYPIQAYYDGDDVYNGIVPIKYDETSISGDGWCINANSAVGSYWYRADITLDSSTVSSPGKINNNYLESSAYDVGIENVLKVSRKSTNANPLVAEMEAFKNVPFVGRTPNAENGKSINYLYKGMECYSLVAIAAEKAFGKSFPSDSIPTLLASSNVEVVKDIGTGEEIRLMKVSEIVSRAILFRDEFYVLFLYNENKREYDHALVFVDDNGNNAIDWEDDITYTSSTCLVDGPSTQKGTLVNAQGNICYTQLKRYRETDPKATLVRLKV